MRILEEFWYGNVEPTEYDTSSCKELNAIKASCLNSEFGAEHKLLSQMPITNFLQSIEGGKEMTLADKEKAYYEMLKLNKDGARVLLKGKIDFAEHHYETECTVRWNESLSETAIKNASITSVVDSQEKELAAAI